MISLDKIKRNSNKLKKSYGLLHDDGGYNTLMFFTIGSIFAVIANTFFSLIGNTSWLFPCGFFVFSTYGFIKNNKIEENFEPKYNRVLKKFLRTSNLEEHFDKYKDIIDRKTQEELYLLTLKKHKKESGHLSYINFFNLIDKIKEDEKISTSDLKEFNIYIDFIILLDKELEKIKNFYTKLDNKVKVNKIISL